MITKKTATEIARTHLDIEAAEKLLEEVDKELANEKERRGFHGEINYTARHCQLGWPSLSGDGYRLYSVEPRIARAVIVAHIADQHAKLEKLNMVAALEVSAK